MKIWKSEEQKKNLCTVYSYSLVTGGWHGDEHICVHVVSMLMDMYVHMVGMGWHVHVVGMMMDMYVHVVDMG